MKRRLCGMTVLLTTVPLAAVLLMTVIGGRSNYVGAQETEGLSEKKELRYEFKAHNFIVEGVEYEIFIKLDQHTGRTWRFHAGQLKWEAISEPSKGSAPVADDRYRYEMYAHDYNAQSGAPTELFVRADLLTGRTWIYRGIFKSWKVVEQDK